MASLRQRNNSFQIIFRYHDRQHTFTLDETDQVAAVGAKAQIEELLRLLKRNLLDLPRGCTIEEFLYHRGKPPEHSRPSLPKEATLAEVRDSYLNTHANGTIEQNTLDTCKLHLAHFVATLSGTFPINALTLADLQRHVDRRSKDKNRRGGLISPTTIKKEVATLAGVWIWGARMNLVRGEFPGRGLRYPKLDEPPPFMTWDEVQRAIAADGDEDLWDCLYLQVTEIAALLAHVREHAAHPFIYPMFCFAAYTGARRSEMMRAQVTDIDYVGQTVLIREKKRKRGTRSHRRVPMTPFLAEVLKEWLAVHPGGPHLFCLPGTVERSKKRSTTTGHRGEKTRPSSLKGRMATVRQREKQPVASLSRKEAHDHFKRTLDDWYDADGTKKESKWKVLKGWHVLRHSFISACASKGTDQRLIDEWTGHSTEEQRKRYRHLWPSTQQQAIMNVFG